jgi:hypothetical protein
MVPRSSPAKPADKTVAAALTLIQSRKGKGMFGKEIIAALKKKRIEITLPTFQKHIVPKLKIHGVQNHRSRGGYYIDPASAD